MAGGYGQIPSDPVQRFAGEIQRIWTALRDLQRPTGTSISSLVRQVQATLANIDATVAAAIAANSYTRSQTDERIASPGDISPGNVSASGNVTAAGAGVFTAGVSSVGVYNNLLTSAYRVQYVNSGGAMGYVPSSRRFKQDIQPAPDVKAAMLALQVVTFRYIEAVEAFGDDAAVEWGVIAEDVDALGLHWLVDYDEDGKPFGVRYERLALALIPVVQDHELRLRAAGL